MRKIKKLATLVGVLILSIANFAFEISDLRFGEIVKVGEKKVKEYTLTNNTTTEKIYKLGIEGDNLIKIIPNTMTLKPLQEKKFKIEVEGNNIVGKHEYFLNIKEINKEQSKDKVDINKTIRIKQTYTVN